MKKLLKTISILLICTLCIAFSACAPQVELTTISATGAKIEFAYNEDFSSNGLVVKAQYSDGSEEEISDYTIDSSAYNKTVAGTYSISVNYNGKSASYDVVVNAPSLTGITISGAKTQFYSLCSSESKSWATPG